jgi:tetratricopeptide (TPR) repeat protein
LPEPSGPVHGGVGHVVLQRGPDPLYRVVVRAVPDAVQQLQPGMLLQVGADLAGMMDAVVIADHDDHRGGRKRPEQLVQQRDEVRRAAAPEVTGLLALILLTSARSAARADQGGALVLLADQDRSRWDQDRLAEGRILTETALARHRPGPYQLQAAIAACHADAATAADTDWRQIAALYSELLRFDPSPVIEANRAIAVAYAEGPAAGLAILDTLAASSRLAAWPQLHVARGALLAQCGRHEAAISAYRDALALEPAGAVRAHVASQIAALGAAPAPNQKP